MGESAGRKPSATPQPTKAEMASPKRVKTRNSQTGVESEGTAIEIVEASEPFSASLWLTGR